MKANIKNGKLKEVNRALFQTLLESYDSFEIEIDSGFIIIVNSKSEDDKTIYSLELSLENTKFRYAENVDKQTLLTILTTLSKFNNISK